jgi:hypothetical protein
MLYKVRANAPQPFLFKSVHARADERTLAPSLRIFSCLEKTLLFQFLRAPVLSNYELRPRMFARLLYFLNLYISPDAFLFQKSHPPARRLILKARRRDEPSKIRPPALFRASLRVPSRSMPKPILHYLGRAMKSQVELRTRKRAPL